MEDIVVLKNKIVANEMQVYACGRETFKKVKAEKADLPHNWIVYVNPLCAEGQLDQANLEDEKLKEFIFNVVLPKFEFVIGEKI